MQTSTEITGLLIDWSNGDAEALEKLFPMVERELHRLAHNHMRKISPGNSLQTTALINETYLRLVDQNRVTWQNRAHFFGIAAKMMRRILLNYIRDRKRLKRGGNAIAISLSQVQIVSNERSNEILALDDALERLSKLDKRKGQVVELRFFGGLSVEETAEVLGISKVTVMRDWRLAKTWLCRELSPDD